jgi:hypothetical protein
MLRTFGAMLCLGMLTYSSHVMAQFNGVLPEAPAERASWEVEAGADYSVGSYGLPMDTTAVRIPVSLRAQFDRFRLEVTVPYLYVEGPGSFASGIVVPGSGTMTRRSGLGDTTAGLAWAINRGAPTSFELEGTVKIPTADDQLGTGQADFLAQANVYRAVSEGVMLYASAGYHWIGDYPLFPLDDGVFGIAGVRFQTSERTSVGLIFAYHQSYAQYVDDKATISPAVAWGVTPRLRLSAFGAIGLTNSAPDYGFGLRLGVHGTTP